jgi:predicted permease
VGPGYFTAVGIPLLRGRDIGERDTAGAPRVAVINEAMAKFYFPNDNPIGKHLAMRVGQQQFQLEIVGVARNAQDHNLSWDPLRRFYVSFLQPIDGITTANFEIQTVENPGGVADLVRRAVQDVDRNLMILGVRDLRGLIDQTLVQERLMAKLSAFFGVLATLLAAIGLYGVMAYEVTQRTSEIGLRLALGAQRSDVLRLVLKNGMSITLLGVGIGLAGAVALTRIIQSQLYAVNPIDPAAYAGMSALFVTVALCACGLPARRASKVNPMEALRYE